MGWLARSRGRGRRTRGKVTNEGGERGINSPSPLPSPSRTHQPRARAEDGGDEETADQQGLLPRGGGGRRRRGDAAGEGEGVRRWETNVARDFLGFPGRKNMQLWPGKRRGVLSFVSPFSQKDTPITAVGGWGGGKGGGAACTRRAQVGQRPPLPLTLSLSTLSRAGGQGQGSSGVRPSPQSPRSGGCSII